MDSRGYALVVACLFAVASSFSSPRRLRASRLAALQAEALSIGEVLQQESCGGFAGGIRRRHLRTQEKAHGKRCLGRCRPNQEGELKHSAQFCLQCSVCILSCEQK